MLYDKICGLQIDFSEFYSVNSQKTVPPNDLEVHQIKAPSIGQSSHGRAMGAYRNDTFEKSQR